MHLESWLRDVQYGLRLMARTPGVVCAAVVSLGLGIGANTAIFSVVNAAIFRGQPIAHPERVVDIYQNGANAGGADATRGQIEEEADVLAFLVKNLGMAWKPAVQRGVGAVIGR